MNSPIRIWHPFTNSALDPPPLQVEKAEGVYLHTKDGPKILDAISSWWVNLHGHANPRIAAAIAGQARKVEHVILAGFTHDAAEELAARLRKWTAPELTHLFFSDDGSTAVEVALKIAVQHFSNQGRTEKREIVALEHGYHGDTAGAMSVSDDSPFTEPFRAMRYPVHRVHSAYCYRCPVGLQRETCRIECVQQLETLLAERGEKIATVIVEPLLQGAGGMITHPVEFLTKVRALCTRHNVLLIADEVLTGFGRTGKMFACDLAGVVPDLMCLSKGLTGGFLPMGVTLATAEIYESFYATDRAKTFFHSSSYTGNAIACAAALANLEISEREPVAERVRAIADHHMQALAPFRGRAEITDVRQTGTIAAIELLVPDAGYLATLGPKLNAFYLERDILLRALGNVVYLLPPYCVRAGELDRI